MTRAVRRNHFFIAILAVALTTVLRFGLGLLWPSISPFGLYYLTTLFVTVAYGATAGLTAGPLGIITGWWLFVPPPYAFFPVPDDAAANITLSFLISVAVVAIAARE